MGIVLLLGIAMTVFVKTILHARLQASIEKRGLSIAKRIAADTINPILAEQYWEAQLAMADLLAAEDDIVYVYVHDAHGAVVASETRENVFSNTLPSRVLSSRKDGGVQTVVIEQEPIIDIDVPLFNGAAGHMHVGISEAPVRRIVNNTILLLMGVILAVLIIGAGLTVVFSTSITRPISELAIAAASVGQGDLSARASVTSNDETGQLAIAFNKMVESRMHAEAALVAEEKKLRDITSNLGEGLLVLDEACRVTFMNPEAETLLGWTERELLGKDLHEIIHTQDRSGLPKAPCPNLKALATGERMVVHDDVFMRKDGAALPVSYIAAPFVEAGSQKALVVAFQDITVRKQREADREQLLRAYEDALNKVKTLGGLLPICCSCKKIRDDSGYWKQIEEYIRQHSDAEFSHGICPDCLKRLFPQYSQDENS